MTPSVILHLFSAIPVLYWPVLVAELVRLLPEIRAYAALNRGGWIEYDTVGRLWLVPAPPQGAHLSPSPAGTLPGGLASQRRRLAIALCVPCAAHRPPMRTIGAGLPAPARAALLAAPDTS